MSRPVDPIWTIEPDGSLRFDPSSQPQATFIDSPAQELLFSGMYGNGKSVAMCIKAWKLCERYPGIRGVVLRRHYSDLLVSTLRLFPRLFGKEMWDAGVQGGKEPASFEFRNGSGIDFFGISGDSDRTQKLKSTEYGFGMADEVNELSESEWDMLMGRLRQPRVPIHQAFGACNPDNPGHWLYRRFAIAKGSHRQWRDDPCLRCSGKDCRACGGTGTRRVLARELVMAGANDNNQNHPPEWIAWRNGLTGLRAARYRDGKWVAYEGSVFVDWDPDDHLIDREHLPESWRRWGWLPPPDWERVQGIDLGYDNPFSVQYLAISPEGVWYRYRELYMSRRTIDLHAKTMLSVEREEREQLLRVAASEPRLERAYGDLIRGMETARYCDHDRGEREQLFLSGISTTPANKEIGAGLQTLIALMDRKQQRGQRLYVVRDALVEVDEFLRQQNAPTCLEDEVPGYRWAKTRSGGREDQPKDLPVDENNHAIDALRYAVHSHLTAVSPGLW